MVLLLENSSIKVGVDETRGGGIAWLSAAGSPVNLVNCWDCGRHVQQSYYGKADGSKWSGKDWCWNPVQCGSWEGKQSELLECRQLSPTSLSISCIPRNWGGQELLSDVTMSSVITLRDRCVHVHFSIAVVGEGGADNPRKHQELPAAFFNRQLSQLVLYTGESPWTNDPTVTLLQPGAKNEYYTPTEKWAAYVDPATGVGAGVYSPSSTLLTTYRVGPDGSQAASDCCYLAPLDTFAVEGGVYEYDCYLAVGSVEEIRTVFYQAHFS